MLTLQMAVKELAENSTQVTGLISSRFYSGNAPESATLPYVVANVISADPMHHMRGSSGMAIVRVQLDCYAASLNTASNVLDKIRLAIDGQRTTATVGSESMNIRMCHWQNDNTAFVNPFDGQDINVKRASHDYMVAYEFSTT